MTKIKIQILGVEKDKDGKPMMTSAGRPMARFNTTAGWMSCFDKALIKRLEEVAGDIWVEIVEKGNYKNISKIYDNDSPSVVDAPKEVIKKTSSKYEPTSMYVSYAKDLFIALLDQGAPVSNDALMEEAIELVIKAKQAFE